MIPQQQQPQQAIPQQQPNPSQSAPQQAAQVPITPSQQPMGKDLALYVAHGLDLISNQQTRDSFVTMLKSSDPVSSLAKCLVDLVIRKLDAAMRSKGTEVPDMVKMYGSHALIMELSKVQKAAKIADLDNDHIELAYSTAVQDYIKGEIQAGRINPTKLQMQTKAGMAKLDPKHKAEIESSMQRIQTTAKKYQGGR